MVAIAISRVCKSFISHEVRVLVLVVRLIHHMCLEVFSGDDDLYIHLLQNIRGMMECISSLGDQVCGCT